MKQSAKRKKEAILLNYSTQGPDKGARIAGSPPLGRNDAKQWLGKEGEGVLTQSFSLQNTLMIRKT